MTMEYIFNMISYMSNKYKILVMAFIDRMVLLDCEKIFIIMN